MVIPIDKLPAPPATLSSRLDHTSLLALTTIPREHGMRTKQTEINTSLIGIEEPSDVTKKLDQNGINIGSAITADRFDNPVATRDKVTSLPEK